MLKIAPWDGCGGGDGGRMDPRSIPVSC